jgi:hypothetical protein
MAIHAEETPEQATAVQLFVAVHTDLFLDPSLPAAQFGVGPTFESVRLRRPDVVRSHGPPAATRSEPRAPPLSSVLI